MRVKELIKALQKLPQSYEVMVDGYEGGITPADPPSVVEVALNANTEGYYGPHEPIGQGYNETRLADFERKNVVVLHR